VPVYEGTREIDIPAPPEACFAVLTDYEQLPEWQRMVRRCEVLTRDEYGRAAEVEYEIDAVLRRVTYRIRHLYDEPSWVGSEYLGGDFECFEGEWRFDAQEEATHVTFHLRIDPGLRIPSQIAKLLNDAVMGQSVRDLKARVLAVGGGRR
jgi:ribosome-associated toxin RatA of RatAB toxin-antitoxin module